MSGHGVEHLFTGAPIVEIYIESVQEFLQRNESLIPIDRHVLHHEVAIGLYDELMRYVELLYYASDYVVTVNFQVAIEHLRDGLDVLLGWSIHSLEHKPLEDAAHHQRIHHHRQKEQTIVSGLGQPEDGHLEDQRPEEQKIFQNSPMCFDDV